MPNPLKGGRKLLVLKNIVKDYVAGDSAVRALNDVTLAFRKNEFVSILGHSGCGKTTLLNIIGGLDRYTSGVMSIKGISTEKYKDSDWDTYRNHSIGFVFQTYNLIPHQSVLSNVELALTLTGVSASERKRRAIEVLKRVGLGDQIHKKPNQMSGGQMQRVAIARALINDPEILLADEPTGALDTDTSVQIMDILKEISHDKLIIMVTHNPELAEQYSDRIIRLKDGQITGDTNPYSPEKEEAECSAYKEETALSKKEQKKRRPSMSFWTALSLSFNNLLTKKTRTILTSFAGSIGIIGIALILSLSNGINAYINKIQRETLSSYPISLLKEEMDMSSMISSLIGSNEDKKDRPLDKVYVSTVTYDLMQSMINPDMSTNNLKKFKEYLESGECKIKDYVPLIRYSYNVNVNAFVKDKSTDYVKADIGDLYQNMMTGMGVNSSTTSSMTSMMSSSAYTVWGEILPPEEGSNELIHDSIKSEYDLIYGEWPKDKSDVLLVVTGNNEISDMALYALGLVSYDDMLSAMLAAMRGEQVDTSETTEYSYEEICNITYKLIPTSAYYVKNEDNEWIDASQLDDKATFNGIVASGLELGICGIIRQSPDATATSLNGTLVYTSALTDYIIEETANSEIVRAQIENPDIDVFTGLPFNVNDESILEDTKKPEAFKNYVSALSVTKRAEIYRKIITTPTDEYVKSTTDMYMAAAKITADSSKEEMMELLIAQAGDNDPELIKMYFETFDAKQLYDYIRAMMEEMVRTSYADEAQKLISSIENTPSISELDAEKATKLLSIISPDPARELLVSLLTMSGEDASSVEAMPIMQVYTTLGTVIKMMPSASQTPMLYAMFSQKLLPEQKSEYLIRLYLERTQISEATIRTEISSLTPEEISSRFDKEIENAAKESYLTDTAPSQNSVARDQKIAAAFTAKLDEYTSDELIALYNTYVPTVSSSTLKDNYTILSVADIDDPDSIYIYAKTFEDKEAIADLITAYNNSQTDEQDKISYTDYIGLLLSSITKIINAISYVLIFFVSISLVVSSIMIGIITYISVLERTKEIGILRAMGASKRDVSRVFNAETLIIGFVSGMIGIIVTVLLNIPISLIIRYFSDISGLSTLPLTGAVILVIISMLLTFIAGLIPSGIAAKKEPVESLRSE